MSHSPPSRAALHVAPDAGTSVAIHIFAMRAVELIIIYLAAAAPVAVVFFLRRRARTRLTHAATRTRLVRDIFHAALAGLLFPFALATRALTRLRDTRKAPTSYSTAAHGAKLDAARKSLLAALYNFEDHARELRSRHADPLGRRADAAAIVATAAHALQSNVERYAGLTLALAAADTDDAEPAAHETELARVAGRAGEDLEIAGRCTRRRNLSRLREHQAHSRLELLHALAALQDALDLNGNAQAASHAHRDAHETAHAASQQLPAALLRVYERAFDLFMLHEDGRSVQTLTRLLDATRARLYRHQEPDAARTPRDAATGEAPCKPRSSQTTPPHHNPQTSPRIPQPSPRAA